MTETLKQRFDTLDQRRQSLITRNIEYAEMSIPSLLLRCGTSEVNEIPVPFSSTTARYVTRLASRLTTTLMPLNNMPFFMLELDDAEPVAGEDPSEEQKVLARLERRIMRKLGTTNIRDITYTAMQHLEVVGTCVVQGHDNYNFSLHRLNNVVIRRRKDGEWHEIIIREFVDPSMLPEELVEAGFTNAEEEQLSVPHTYQGDVENAIYTKVVNNHKGGCTVTAEFKGRNVPTLSGDYPVCPYAVLRWTLVDGENYGRGLIEDNCGDVRSLEIAAEALLDGLMAAAEYRFGVNPAGITEIHDMQESENGSFVPAAQGDVFPITLENQGQIQSMAGAKQSYEQNLGQTFLSVSSLQRQGERVTATEWRLQATELEQALGGVFGAQARDLLPTIVRWTMYRMLKDGLLIPDGDPAGTELAAELEKPDGVIGIKIRTGLEALNREIENEKMNNIMDRLSRLPEPAQQVVIWSGIVNRYFSTEGVEPAGLVKSVEQVQQEAQMQQQQQMQQMVQQQAVQSGGRIAEQQAAGVNNV